MVLTAHIRVAGKAQRTSSDGIVFDSASEMRRWEELRLLERARKITDLARQVPFPLTLPNGKPILIRSPRYPNGRRCVYTADFSYTDLDDGGAFVVEEHKAIWTEAARLRLAVAEACYGFRVRITGSAKMTGRRRTERNTA